MSITLTYLLSGFLLEKRRNNENIIIVPLARLLLLLVLVSTSVAYTTASSYGLVEKSHNNMDPLSKPLVLDPNPTLVTKDGTLKNDVSSAAGVTTNRIGAIADGSSKLILIVESNKALNF